MNEQKAMRAAEVHDVMARTRSKTIEHYQPELLGEGGEHAVFVMAPNLSDRKTVVKLHRFTTMLTLRRNLERGTPLDYLTDDERVILDKRLEAVRASIRRFRLYFGDAALAERVSVAKVPVTQALLRTLTSPRDSGLLELPKGTSETLAVLAVQERAPEEAFGKDSFDLRTRYLEQDRKSEPMYKTYNGACLDHPETPACADVLPLLTRDHAVFAAAERDPELRNVLGEFFSNAIRFTQETGDTLDLIGKDNVRCYKDKDGSWRMVLIDARFVSGFFKTAREAIVALQHGEKLSHGQNVAVLNAINYVRFVNAAAATLGIPDRLRLSDEPLADITSKLWDATSLIRHAA